MTTAIKLYEATEQLDLARDLLIESAGELTPEIEELLAYAQDTFTQKAERVALFIQEMLATAAAVKAERERLQALERSYMTAAANLKHYLQREMQRADVQRVDGTLAKMRLQKSPPSVKCTLNEDALATLALDAETSMLVRLVPASYVLNIDMVKTIAKAGQPLPDGITVEQGTHVRIS